MSTTFKIKETIGNSRVTYIPVGNHFEAYLDDESKPMITGTSLPNVQRAIYARIEREMA